MCRHFIVVFLTLLIPTLKSIAQNNAIYALNNTLPLASLAITSSLEWEKSKPASNPPIINLENKLLKRVKDNIQISDTTNDTAPSLLTQETSGFNTIISHSNVFIQWKASYVKQMAELAVEQSTDGINFREASYIKINPSETINGMRISQEDGLYYYRLKMLDNNGNVNITETLACNTDTKASGVVSIFPNSITDEWLAAVNIVTSYRGKIKVAIIDNYGQQLIEFPGLIIEENTKIPIGVAAIPKGTYSIFVSQIDGTHIGTIQELAKI